MCNLTPCAGGEKRLESFSTIDSSRNRRRPCLSNPWNSLSTPSLSINEGHSQGYKCAGDLHSESGMMGEMKCMKCLGSGQQFTGALAAKEECLSFLDSDPRLEKEQQRQPERRCFFTCSKRRRPESHSPPLGKTRDC